MYRGARLAVVSLMLAPLAAGCGGSSGPPEIAAIESTWGELGDGKKFAICEDAMDRGTDASDALAEQAEKRYPDEYIRDDLYDAAGFFLNGEAKGYQLQLQRGGFEDQVPPPDPCREQRLAFEDDGSAAPEATTSPSEDAAQAAAEAQAAEEAALRDPVKAILAAASTDTTPQTLARIADATTDARVACALANNANLPEPAFELLRGKRYDEDLDEYSRSAPARERVEMCLAESSATPAEVLTRLASTGETKLIRQTARTNLR